MTATTTPEARPRRRPPLLRDVYGALLRRLRTRQGRTLADVAGAAGISIAYLSEVERGLKEPSSEILDAVCRALGSSVTGLVGAAHAELLALAAPPHQRRVLDLTVPDAHAVAAPATATSAPGVASLALAA